MNESMQFGFISKPLQSSEQDQFDLRNPPAVCPVCEASNGEVHREGCSILAGALVAHWFASLAHNKRCIRCDQLRGASPTYLCRDCTREFGAAVIVGEMLSACRTPRPLLNQRSFGRNLKRSIPQVREALRKQKAQVEEKKRARRLEALAEQRVKKLHADAARSIGRFARLMAR